MKKAMIGMSGGVDSSVAAFLTQQAGFQCIGATMRLFSNDALGEDQQSTCCSLDDVEDARSVCRRMGIPHYAFNFQDDFRSCVMEKFVRCYEAGQTPSPCIDCNRYLKFGTMLRRAQELGCDYVVTGHYARICRDAQTGRYLLYKAADIRKDQTYFLYPLTQQMLAHTLFPLGELTKPQVREIARLQGFVTARKHDSQDICFVPDGDYVTFLRRQGLTLTPGDFLDEAGRVLGRHRGLPCYTIGQGKGLGVAVGRHVYVLEKDRDRNAIVLGDDAALYASSLLASHVNWISGQIPAVPVRCAAKTRYSQVETPCTAYPLPDGGLRVVFDQPQRAITAGQAVVLYDGDEVLGGGTIEKSE